MDESICLCILYAYKLTVLTRAFRTAFALQIAMNVCLYATTNNAGPLFASAKKSLEFVSNVCSCACIVILAVYTCLSAEFKCEMIEVRLIAICLPSPRSLVRLHSSWTLLTLTDNNSRNCYTPIYRATCMYVGVCIGITHNWNPR